VEKRATLDKIPLKYRRPVIAQLKTISLDIQRRRKEKGWSQEELAEMLDLSVRKNI
jgi:ribosome-binding protein aMBF1 (putative translation factor)